VTQLIDYEAFCGVPGHEHDGGSAGKEWDIEPTASPICWNKNSQST